jgi:hypothetical protein
LCKIQRDFDLICLILIIFVGASNVFPGISPLTYGVNRSLKSPFLSRRVFRARPDARSCVSLLWMSEYHNAETDGCTGAWFRLVLHVKCNVTHAISSCRSAGHLPTHSNSATVRCHSDFTPISSCRSAGHLPAHSNFADLMIFLVVPRTYLRHGRV